MEESPLVLQARPEHFEPKIVNLYRQLFENIDDDETDDGFWTEFFLLKPDGARLSRLIEERSPDFLLHHNHITRDLLSRSITTIQGGKAPTDEHALETLGILLKETLSKRYHSPSSDIIEVLSGLDDVDYVFAELITVLDSAIRNGRALHVRESAVKVVLVVTTFGFQTSLLTYVTHRDLFPSLVQLIHDDAPRQSLLAIVLTGVLANCNKFEIHNQYQSHISALTGHEVFSKLSGTIRETCTDMCNQYVVIQEDDVAASWSIGATLSLVGLGSFSKVKTVPPPATEAEAKALFAEQPKPDAAILLALYELVHNNKQFCAHFISGSNETETQSSGIIAFLSFSSYLLQHAYRTARSALYSHLVLLTIRIMVEDNALQKRLLETKGEARLCRQRQPFLPIVHGPRALTAVVLDIAMDCINHNLRTKLDVNIYYSALGILIRIVLYCSKTRTRLSYHWPELWRALLAFARFLTQYAAQLKGVLDLDLVVHDLVNLLTLCLTYGEIFLPDSAALDDLFYKIVESHGVLEKLRDAYSLDQSPVASNMATLLSAGSHFTDALQKAGGKSKNVRPLDVMKGIKEGYETLTLEAGQGTDHWTRYREPDHKIEIKKITRLVIVDAKALSLS